MGGVMRSEHIRETEIQRYLDNDLPEREKISLEKHIGMCSSCRIEIKNYRELYQILADDRDMSLPADFSSAIMAKLPTTSNALSGIKIWSYLLTVASILAGLAITVYYTGLDVYRNLWTGIETSLTVINLSALLQFFSRISFFPKEYLFVTLIILLSIKFFEHLLFNPRH